MTSSLAHFKDLRNSYPGARSIDIELLSKFFKFNPEKRISAGNAMQDPAFDVIVEQRYVERKNLKNYSSDSSGSSTTDQESAGSSVTGVDAMAESISSHTSQPLLNDSVERQKESANNIRHSVS